MYRKVGEQLHAWVLVKLDHAWYHIDVTWDDPLPDRKGKFAINIFSVGSPISTRSYRTMQASLLQQARNIRNCRKKRKDKV